MASELRVNTINSTAGFGTITVSETGQDLVGITTIENLTTENTLVGAAASFTGNVSVGGVLTYEDVTNIDSVGLITARQGIEIGARPGVAASISVDGNMVVSGVSTFGGVGQFGGNVEIPSGTLHVGDEIAHYGDTDTNIGFPDANTFTVDTAGSERLRITSAGKVGINEDVPQSTLHVASTSNYSDIGLSNSTSGHTGSDGANIFLNNNLELALWNRENSHIRFATNGTERLRITSLGKIGISTGTIDPDGNQLLIRAASTVGTTKGHIMLTGDSATVGEGPQIVFSESGAGSSYAGAYVGFLRSGSNSIGDLVFATRGTSGDADTIPTERLRITSGGAIQMNSDTGSQYFSVGANQDFKWYHDAGGPTIFSDTSNQGLKVSVKDILVTDYTGNSNRLQLTSGGCFNIGSSSNTSYPLNVKTTTATNVAKFESTVGTNEGTEVQIAKTGNSPADNDQVAYLQFSGMDSNLNNTIFGAIIQTSTDVTDGSEDGAMFFYNRNNASFSQVLKINHDGTFTGSGSNDISDERLKENITTITNATDKIKALKGRTFNWKAEAKLAEGTQYGFIAQEMEAVLPELVDDKSGIRQFYKDGNIVPQDEKGLENHDEGTNYAKSVHISGVVPVLVEALKEALTRIETLESEVSALKSS